MLKLIALCLGLILLPGSDILAAENCSLYLEEPTLITSVGQNLDALIISAILEGVGVKTDYLPLAKEGDIHKYKQIIVSPGISYKGIAAMDLKIEDEIKRAKELVEATNELGCQLVLIYLGGFIQGDAKSQKIIDILAPNADAMVIYKDSGGPIDYFVEVAEKVDIPVFFIEDLGNLCAELSHIFSIGMK